MCFAAPLSLVQLDLEEASYKLGISTVTENMYIQVIIPNDLKDEAGAILFFSP